MSYFDWLVPIAEQDEWTVLKLFFLLSMGHVLADFPLQGQYVALYKNRRTVPPKDSGLPSGKSVWCFLMVAHCLIHSAFVLFITGSFFLAAAELVLHFVLDVLKCEKKTSFQCDQLAHFGCKLAYAFWWVYG